MGKDLYFKETPKPQPEQEYAGSVYMPTWGLLSELLGYEEREDIDGAILKKENIKTLEAVNLTAKKCGDAGLCEDMTDLINAMNKYGSITLEIRG